MPDSSTFHGGINHVQRSQQTCNFRKEEVPRGKTYQDKGDGETRQQEGDQLYIRCQEASLCEGRASWAEVRSDPVGTQHVVRKVMPAEHSQ